MEIQAKQPTVKGSEAQFTGDVWIDPIGPRAQPARIGVSIVRFSPGARTAWHSHPRGQTLYVAEGRGRVQSRGGEIVEVRPGEMVYTPPSEWHWHGATPTDFMTHLSMLELDDQGNGATWGAHVSDAEYGAPPTKP